MLILLQQRGRMTAPELARLLEVSARTVLRDVEALSGAGVPIYSVAGGGGGIDLIEGFRTRLTGLTESEVASFLLVGQQPVARLLGLGVAAGAARRKLLGALTTGQRAQAERLDDWFLHDPEPWDGGGPLYGELRRLGLAIERNVEVELAFAHDRLTVRPLALVLKAGDWFLLTVDSPVTGRTVGAAACESAEVDAVRLAGLRGTRLMSTTFIRPPNFQLEKAWADASTKFFYAERPVDKVGGVNHAWDNP